jgi:hypothetical protein
MLNALVAKIKGGNAPRQIGGQAGVADLERIMRLGMSPRQQRLNHLYAWYRCGHYEARKFDWDGKEVLDPIEHEVVATSGFLPPGFESVANLPLRFRRPAAPYGLVKVIVDRFTAMLFSERQHPYVYVDDDPDTNDYIGAMILAGRLWPAMLVARQYGGSTGSVCIGFQFIDGKPVIDVHDPRWVTPDFKDRTHHELRGIEIRYMYPQDERDTGTGKYVTNWYWYRRVIDEKSDTLYAPVLVGNGEEPEWSAERKIDHGFGFCPAVWVQNLPVIDDIDGDPDCQGVFDMIETMDSLLSQANRGIVANCDPTVVISSDAEMGEIKKGSDNALKLPNGSATYMEISGSGPKSALDLNESLRKMVLEVAQCVLEPPNMSVRSATEIERVYSTMLAKADMLREQYGQRAILPLCEQMLAAARMLGKNTETDAEGNIVRQVLTLPKRVTRDAEGTPKSEDRVIGEGTVIGLRWPRYFQYALPDIELAARAAGTAMTGNMIDLESAIRFVAEYFGIADVGALTTKMLEQRESQAAQMGGGLKERFGGEEPILGEEEETEETAPPEEAEWHPAAQDR